VISTIWMFAGSAGLVGLAAAFGGLYALGRRHGYTRGHHDASSLWYRAWLSSASFYLGHPVPVQRLPRDDAPTLEMKL